MKRGSWWGEPELDVLLGFPRQSSLVWTDGMPVWGLHVDADEKALYYWRAEPGLSLEEEIRRAWPGWRVQFLWDRFEEHLRVASMDVELPLATPPICNARCWAACGATALAPRRIRRAGSSNGSAPRMRRSTPGRKRPGARWETKP